MDEGSDEDAQQLEMWRNAHKARFLSGEDDAFDYTAVDGNDEYDDLRQKVWPNASVARLPDV
jgi:hypothetical protein